MRWSGQQVLDEGVGAAPALPGLRGLLRSVRTPEFAGTVFHEVEARSALNRVPGTSPLPFRWTVNPYRGCSHACTYCLAGPTPVLLADGRTRPISELRVGDAIIGTELVDGRRRYVRTTVRAHWTTLKPAHRVTLADGTRLVSSGEHRFLTGRGWRHVTPGWCASGRRPWLRTGDALLGPGALPSMSGAAAARGESYRTGYLCGLVRSDTEAPERSFPSVHLELEALGRAHHYLATTNRRSSLLSAVGARFTSWEVAPPQAPTTAWPPHPDDDWCAGFLAGVLDARGEFTDGVLRMSHSDEQILGRVAGALHRLGFGFAMRRGAAEHSSTRPGSVQRCVELPGGLDATLRFLRRIEPAVARHRELGGAPVSGGPGLEVVSVRALGAELPMYDITTGTGDFVAGGVVSHNCFARNTHTYLDLDAGADFDSQIIVKVNVARVLDRELRGPRWSREPVAMGTNTDPYQRAEGRYRLMPDVIGALARSGTPFSLLTKGTVLTRDLPQLVAAAADVPVGLGVSIALLDRPLQARLEPGTASPQARLDLVRRITDAGLPCGVMVAPVLPLLTDSTEALDALLGRIADAGATGASVLALHLRPGTREWFLAWLAREYPALVEPYARLYRRGAYVDPAYRRALGERVAPLLRRHGLTGAVTSLRGQVESGGAAPAPSAEQLSLL